MRNELNTIEKIERYLLQSMPADERQAFEKEMAENPDLQVEVRLQQELMQGMKTLSLKQQAKKAYSQHRLVKGIKVVSITIGTIALYIAAQYFGNYLSESNDDNNRNTHELPALNENGTTTWADADKYLPYQFFNIDNSKDTVIESEDGIVLAVPAGCFLDQDGKPVNGAVQLEFKEAIESDDILRSGLSTRSGETPLETGGMFYLNARKEGVSLKIDAAKAVYAQVPTDEVKAGMQVYEGKRMPDGSIDWIKPKPLEKFLLPVDIHSLNFYPPGYEDTLAVLGKDAGNKIYKDSLYYSYAALFGTSPAACVADTCKVDLKEVEEDDPFENANNAQKENVVDNKNLLSGKAIDARTFLPAIDTVQHLGINPSKIKAIWNNKFNNTLLATREFETRIPFIHRSCSNAVLDLYVNNLDKKLCTIDSMAAGIAGGQKENFMELAARGDGRINAEKAPHLEKLKKYYADKAAAYTEAARQTRHNYEVSQQKAADRFKKDKATYSEKDREREAENIKKEFAINLENAKRQLGLPETSNTRPVSKNAFTVAVTNPGWKNIDRVISQYVQTRTTMNYTDSISGKIAVIRYEPVRITVKDRQDYDAVFVYAIPDQLNSFMRMQESENTFSEKLNTLMQHEMVCVAYKGEQAYLSYTAEMNPGEYNNMALAAVSKKELNQKLAQIKKHGNEQKLLDEMSFRYMEQKENLRQQKARTELEFYVRVGYTVFPCAFDYDREGAWPGRYAM